MTRYPYRYVPRERSGAYAILLGLYTRPYAVEGEQWTLRSELIRLASAFTDTPFDRPTTGSGGAGGVQATGNGWRTAWSSSALRELARTARQAVSGRPS